MTLNFSFLGNRLVHILSFPKFTLPIEGTHVVEDDAALLR